MSDAENTINPENQHPKTQLPGEDIDIRSAMEDELPPLSFIWPGFLTGTVGVLLAPGAVGKSFWALEAAMSIASSVAGGDLLGLSPQTIGRVAYLAGEDPKPILRHRLHSIAQHLNPSARDGVYSGLTLRSLMGERLDVMNDRVLELLIAEYSGYRLIVLDTLSRMHQLDENNNGDMAQVVTRFERLAVQTGASVLYLHHVNKNSAREGQTDQQQAGRGASSLIDNPRWCGFVARMTDKESEHLSDCYFERSPIKDRLKQFMRFGVSKQNYSEDLPDRWYQRHEGGVLLPVALIEADMKKGSKERTPFADLNGGDNDDRW